MANEHDPQSSLEQAFVLSVLQGELGVPVSDPAFGEGYSVYVGHGESAAIVYIYPQGRRARVISGVSTLELSSISRVSRRRDRLRLEASYEFEELAVEVAPNGIFLLLRQPRNTATGAFEEAPADGQAEAARVTLRGRLGAEPRFRTTAKEKELVASFPLGVHPDAESTTWYSVVVFGERARRLEEKGLVKGQEVEVVGYLHERQGRTRGGGTKVISQVYAAAVRTTLKRPPSA